MVALVAAAVSLVSPSTAIDLWPWTLTPLTARVIACFTAQVGIGALLLSRDERWSAWRLLLQTFLSPPRWCSSASRARGATSTGAGR